MHTQHRLVSFCLKRSADFRIQRRASVRLCSQVMDEGEAKGLLSTVNPKMQTSEMLALRKWFVTFLKRLKFESSLVYHSELKG